MLLLCGLFFLSSAVMWPLNRRFGGARLTLPFLSLSLCCAGVAVGVLTRRLSLSTTMKRHPDSSSAKSASSSARRTSSRSSAWALWT